MSIDKQFHGDLDATSLGQMLAAMTAVKDSAGYVAIERVRGALHGRKGTFALQHSGTMNRGVPRLIITVIPDSGTDQLVGLTGTTTINIVEGKLFYEFEYTRPACAWHVPWSAFHIRRASFARLKASRYGVVQTVG